MNYCFIEVGDLSDLYLVKAKNKKEAKDIIWNKYFKDKNIEDKEDGYEPIYKNEISVTDIKEFDEELLEDGFVML